MAIPIAQLIKNLQKKDPAKEVEFVVVATDGEIVCLNVEVTGADMVTLLGMFKDDNH